MTQLTNDITNYLRLLEYGSVAAIISLIISVANMILIIVTRQQRSQIQAPRYREEVKPGWRTYT